MLTTSISTATFRYLSFRSLSSSSSSSASRPFRILGVQQIAIGSADRSALTQLWGTIFALPVSSSLVIASENVVEDIVRLGPEPYHVEIDLMCPIDAEKSPKVS
jgi:lactoylglutathione lyase